MKKRIALLVLCTAAPVFAGDWPCYRGDAQRSCVTAETLTFPMSLDWIYEPPHPPSPAWTESVRLQEESSFAATRRTPRGQQGT